MDILETIVANTRREVERRQAAVPLSVLLARGADWLERPVRSMRRALRERPPGVIAEFKRRSPSKGWLHPEARVEEVVPAYERAGAAACSVLTDSAFFGGAAEDLRRARALVQLPLLCKDFVVEEYQLYEARMTGADAVLLIAAVLTRDECGRLAQRAQELGMEVLLEIHGEEELSYLTPHVDMLGVNNRHLATFHTSVARSFELAEPIRRAIADNRRAPLLVSESGLSDALTVKQLREAGFRGFLIGETFMKAACPGEALRDFIERTNA
jgi:indole-3-glycerol phosphate synthase